MLCDRIAPPLLAPLSEPIVLELTIYSRAADGMIIPPRTKKTSPVIVTHMKRPILLPSQAYRDWHKGARKSLLAQIKASPDLQRILPLSFPIRLHAVFFRHAKVGDLMGFIDGLADFLNDDLRPESQKKNDPDHPIRVIENDRWIIGFTRETRLEKDAARPRIELRLEEER